MENTQIEGIPLQFKEVIPLEKDHKKQKENQANNILGVGVR